MTYDVHLTDNNFTNLPIWLQLCYGLRRLTYLVSQKVEPINQQRFGKEKLTVAEALVIHLASPSALGELRYDCSYGREILDFITQQTAPPSLHLR